RVWLRRLWLPGGRRHRAGGERRALAARQRLVLLPRLADVLPVRQRMRLGLAGGAVHAASAATRAAVDHEQPHGKARGVSLALTTGCSAFWSAMSTQPPPSAL